MQSSFDRSLSAVLKHEGGWADHPKDPGGATNRGITIANFRRYVKPGGTKADLKALTADQASVVYRKQYWNAVMGDQLPAGIDHATFDYGVNSGPKVGVKSLQRALGVAADGVVGPKTLEAAAASNAAEVINAICDQRMAFLERLKTWPTFGKGWTSRVAGVRKLALQLAAEGQGSEPTPEPQQPAPTTPAAGWEVDWGRVALIALGLGIAGWAIIATLT